MLCAFTELARGHARFAGVLGKVETFIRRAAPGGFSWLPLGWIVYRNVERIVREEMDDAGFQEVHFPALLPREPYEATGRSP